MNFNTSKSNVIRIMPNKRRETLTSSYSLHGQIMESTNKYLGINIRSDLSWSNHVEDVAARGNRTMRFLRRNFRECTPKVKTATYTTLVRPTLEYASAVWDSYKQKDVQLLENVQRRAARYVNNNYTDISPGSVTTMLENLKWTSLEHRRYKIQDTRFAIQAKGPDGKWTRKPLAYRESNNVHLLITRPPEICVNLVFKHIHAASSYTICRQFVPFIYCPL